MPTLRVHPRALLTLTGLAGALCWSYWPALCEMANKWAKDSQYSHGYLVPLFSLYLLWLRRDRLASAEVRANGWGVLFLMAGVFLRLAGVALYFSWLEAVSLLPLLAGATLLLGGRRALHWAWPAIAFLFFMIPLPYRLETGLSQPLQSAATRMSAYTLQTLGRPALTEGNVIIVNDARIGVVEACNGLGMLILFFALATAVAILSRRPLLDRALIMAGAAPIAVVSNVVRITVTSFLHETVGSRWADLVFHDLAGWLMMPLALALLWVEIQVLSRLFITRAPAPRSTAAQLAGAVLVDAPA